MLSIAWVVQYNFNWVNEINQICYKANECKVAHNEMIESEIEKPLMVIDGTWVSWTWNRLKIEF